MGQGERQHLNVLFVNLNSFVEGIVSFQPFKGLPNFFPAHHEGFRLLPQPLFSQLLAANENHADERERFIHRGR